MADVTIENERLQYENSELSVQHEKLETEIKALIEEKDALQVFFYSKSSFFFFFSYLLFSRKILICCLSDKNLPKFRPFYLQRKK